MYYGDTRSTTRGSIGYNIAINSIYQRICSLANARSCWMPRANYARAHGLHQDALRIEGARNLTWPEAVTYTAQHWTTGSPILPTVQPKYNRTQTQETTWVNIYADTHYIQYVKKVQTHTHSMNEHIQIEYKIYSTYNVETYGMHMKHKHESNPTISWDTS